MSKNESSSKSKKISIIDKGRELLEAIREACRFQGYFTIGDLASKSGMPRSTISDWVKRFLKAGLIEEIEPAKGRKPAKYIHKQDSELFISPCKRIFVTVDLKASLAEIYHECISIGALNYCAKEYSRSGGSIVNAFIEGPLLRLRMMLTLQREVKVGRPPLPAIGVVGLEIDNGEVELLIKAFGGPAYSIVKAMKYARGVLGIDWFKRGDQYYGKIRLKAYEHLSIGVDDTDREGDGATWALAIELMRELKNKLHDVEPIAHKVVQLYPYINEKTGGNYASLVEVAIPPGLKERVLDVVHDIVASRTKSPNTSVAFMWGLTVPERIKKLLNLARKGRVTVQNVLDNVNKLREVVVKEVTGLRGCIGAVAALACSDPSISMA
ncbi:MAG: helix-turn-helix domain-containing protein [Candidatus Nezhaarchaeales archaeon]